MAGLPVSGSTAAPAVFIGALADEPASAEAPREAHVVPGTAGEKYKSFGTLVSDLHFLAGVGIGDGELFPVHRRVGFE